ncbi:MAG TPA: L,D-transpeptidase family protein [Blastocatellia bacterium]|nr:L,D-transpeptidase family protein [Blastocatellia bacterium]
MMRPKIAVDRGMVNFALTVWWRLLLVEMVLALPAVAMGQAPPQPAGPQKPPVQVKPKPVSKQPELGQEDLQEARELLAALGYWVDPDAEGWDVTLRHAVVAFQKVEGRPRTGKLTAEEIKTLRRAQRPQALEPGYAHLEVDLSRQVLFVIDDDGTILKILPVSTGSGQLFTEGGKTRRAVTPTGHFTVGRKIEGWRKSPLGLLYYPNYLHDGDGVAIHGNPSVPARPASHGCIRIPMFAAKELSEMAAVGTIVLIDDSRQTAPTVASSIP